MGEVNESLKMKNFVIFHKNDKIIAVEEEDASQLNWTGATFLKAVQSSRMGKRILKKIMES